MNDESLRDEQPNRYFDPHFKVDTANPDAQAWFDHVMRELEEFELTLTLCFTPAYLGVQPHHTSPPRDVALFAEFCEAVVGRYSSLEIGPQVRAANHRENMATASLS